MGVLSENAAHAMALLFFFLAQAAVAGTGGDLICYAVFLTLHLYCTSNTINVSLTQPSSAGVIQSTGAESCHRVPCIYM